MELERPDIISRLERLDADLVAEHGFNNNFEIVIAGGSALLLQGYLENPRTTRDIDVLKSSYEVEPYFESLDMNNHVSTFLYQFPTNWEERLEPVEYDGMALKAYTLSAPDCAISKLISGREVDLQDVQNMYDNDSYTIDELQEIAEDTLEVEVNLSEEQFSNFWSNYQDFLYNNDIDQDYHMGY